MMAIVVLSRWIFRLAFEMHIEEVVAPLRGPIILWYLPEEVFKPNPIGLSLSLSLTVNVDQITQDFPDCPLLQQVYRDRVLNL